VLYANGATEPNKLVWGETVSVTPNTDYVFTFYAVDANSGGGTDHGPYDAVLLGSVNGVASVQLNTNATWQQATLIWNSGSNTTAHLSLVDLNTSAGANDFAVDLISLLPVSPIMSNAVFNAATNITTLSGTAEANSSVSIFDGTKLIGNATAAADGTWILQTNVTGNGVHSYTEKSIDGFGNTISSTGVTLYTPAAKTSLQGGSGNDVLIGKPNDTLTGGGGSDTFVFNPNFGKNVISDFNVSQDGLRFDHTLFSNATASQVLSQTHDTSAGAVIIVDANDMVTLTGVSVAQLQSHLTDIHFV
jgi:hypothetical protein